MSKTFNTAGPCRADQHYMLPPLERLPPPLLRLIERENYFVLHAPRQTGKTTILIELARKLTAEGKYAAALVTCQQGAAFTDDIGAAEQTVLQHWQVSLEQQLPPELRPPPWPASVEGSAIGDALAAWSRACQSPIVLFLDEIDALRGPALISVLHQLRARFPERPRAFPASIALVGLRDVADYKYASGGTAPPSSFSPSPFNILVESLTLRDFTFEEVDRLYRQHTDATGQVFEATAVARAYELTRGQPWLVNALAYLMTTYLAPDPAVVLTTAHVEEARKQLLARRDVHLRSLAERLRDPRIRPVLEPVLSDRPIVGVPDDDVRFAMDLGLLRRSGGTLEVANPIYREVLLDALTFLPEASVPRLPAAGWLTDGRLDPDKLLKQLMQFWLQHGSALVDQVDFPELAPQLIVLAFLQRVANGGGYVNREVAAQNGRMDVFLELGDVRVAIELKIWRSKEGDPAKQGLEQLDAYMKHVGTEHGWLIVFDKRAGREKLSERMRLSHVTSPGGRRIPVLRA